MSARTFKVEGRVPITVSAFSQPDGFLSLTFGEFHGGQYSICLSPDQARSLGAILEAGIQHAENVERTGLGESAVTA